MTEQELEPCYEFYTSFQKRSRINGKLEEHLAQIQTHQASEEDRQTKSEHVAHIKTRQVNNEHTCSTHVGRVEKTRSQTHVESRWHAKRRRRESSRVVGPAQSPCQMAGSDSKARQKKKKSGGSACTASSGDSCRALCTRSLALVHAAKHVFRCRRMRQTCDGSRNTAASLNHVCFKIVYPTQNSQCPPGTAPKTKKTNAATISVLPREQARERDDVVTQEAEIHMFVVMPRFLNLVLATCICYLPPSILARSPFLGPPCGVERRSGGGLAGCFTQRTDQQQFKPRNGMGWQKTAYNN